MRYYKTNVQLLLDNHLFTVHLKDSIGNGHT